MDTATALTQHATPDHKALAAWRTLAPTDVDDAVLDALRATLAAGPLQLFAPGWRAAAEGDVLSAVRIAVDRLHDGTPPTSPAFDLAMTALLPVARRGSDAAALVLAHALQAVARADGDERAAELARTWTSRRRGGVVARSPGRS